jgi:3-oxoacyl-[acyl-carrier protein] reductase
LIWRQKTREEGWKLLLRGKSALITGAAKGIGAACADVFAKNGVKSLILVDVDETLGHAKSDRLNKKCDCVFIQADISRQENVDKVFTLIKEKNGRLDILVNVAGICSTKNIFEEDIESWNRMVDINLRGTYLFGKEALRIMMPQKYGRIISMASIAGQLGGIRTSPAYAASKAGVIALTKTFAKIGAKVNVTANCISPGLVDTDMTRNPDFVYELKEIPLGRIAEPGEIANVALFLASDLASYITGQCINVNGGMLMS